MVFCNARRSRHDIHMLIKRIKRWLGWENTSSWFDFGDLPGLRRTPPTPPKVSRPPVVPRAGEPKRAQPPAATRQPKSRTPLDILDNPKLTLDKPGDDGFDPYNTGAFNRSTSWEKIGRQRKR
jgi:hypothetical protein